ncbi:MAG: NAD(+) synthase, partial [Bacteroidaceae bacterium]|nr:NAD(+) synthase [Bacteroidaceae bacterium]
MNYGYVKVAAAVPGVKVADCAYNADCIIEQIKQAEEKGVEIVCFPELSITAYSCGDLFAQQLLLDQAELALMKLLDETRQLNVAYIVGMPVAVHGMLLNAAVVCQHGKILGVVPKTYLPNYKEFYEKRWFTSATEVLETSIRLCGQNVPLGAEILFETPTATFGIELCEDVWAPIPPSTYHTLHGADIIFNLSASDEVIGKNAYLRQLLSQQSARCISGYVYSSCGFGESSTDVVYAGNGLIYENGKLLAANERFSLEPQIVVSEIDVEYLRTERRVNTTFSTCHAFYASDVPLHVSVPLKTGTDILLTRRYEPHPFVPQGSMLDERCEEIFAIQVAGLAKRLTHINAQNVVVGISGGLDSTLALLVCVRTFDKLGWSRKGITGITMPGFGTTDRTHDNAVNLMNELGVTTREISIKAACEQHFKDINHDPTNHNVVYENTQARERTQILMDVANQMNGLVVGTGDLSELALGWATYNGDHMSMYGVNASVPKTLVRHLVKWVAIHDMDEAARNTLLDIVDTPISPELIPADEQGNIKQITED